MNGNNQGIVLITLVIVVVILIFINYFKKNQFSVGNDGTRTIWTKIKTVIIVLSVAAVLIFFIWDRFR